MMLTLEDSKVLDDFKYAPSRCASLYSVCLNLNKLRIGETETRFLLNLIGNLLNLSRISLICTRSPTLCFETKSLLSRLAMLVNLQSVSLNLFENSIGDIGA